MNKKLVITFLTTTLFYFSSAFTDEITLNEPVSGPLLYLGIPTVVPGIIEAENFDLGGQNVAYYDDNPDYNAGKIYRDEGVDVQATEGEGGYHLA